MSGSRQHGSHSRYSNGCRCLLCREAHTAYQTERRKRSLAAGTLSHGFSSTFDAGCRCSDCVRAKAAVRRASYLRSKRAAS